MAIAIKQMQPNEAAACEAILRALPSWFGIESAIVDYRRDIEQMETLVAREDNQIVGFITLRQHFPESGEIQVMAIRPEYHRQGIGRQLIISAETDLKARGCTIVQVKTLGASHPDAGYAKTRTFYQSVGYLPLEETDLWGEENPCLIMVKPLR